MLYEIITPVMMLKRIYLRFNKDKRWKVTQELYYNFIYHIYLTAIGTNDFIDSYFIGKHTIRYENMIQYSLIKLLNSI